MRLHPIPARPALAAPVLALLALAVLAACEPGIGGTKGSYRPVEDSCGAAGLQQLVGQPATALTSMQLDQPVRVLAAGQVMTLAFQENRLTARVDEAGRITRLSCG